MSRAGIIKKSEKRKTKLIYEKIESNEFAQVEINADGRIFSAVCHMTDESIMNALIKNKAENCKVAKVKILLKWKVNPR